MPLRGHGPLGGVTYGGIDVGGGGLLWTPGHGFKKIPPDSPLRGVLEIVAAIEALRERSSGQSEEERQRHARALSEQLQGLSEAVNVAAQALGRGPTP
jgi:hypothetical protein